MAFPFLSENGFEQGDRGHFDAETDTETRLDFPHYTTLAGLPSVVGMPWRGAYCMRVNLANDGTPADAYVQETGAWDSALGATIYFRFMFRVSTDLVMANNDEFAIFQLWSGASTVEGGAYINFTTANGLRLGIGETSATSFRALTQGVWHCLELRYVVDSGANDGTLDAWLDGVAMTQVATLTQAAITSGVVGVLSQDAGTTRGTVLFDDIVADDARIYPPVERFPQQVLLTASGHVFVGSGEIEKLDLLSGAATDNVLSVFDTDRAYTLDASSAIVELKNVANNERVAMSDFPVRLQRGCYVALSGTAPRALVKIRWANTYSDGAMRTHALTRVQNPLGA